ncbi:pancreatic lipase-related protein 2-like [Toxorhynchites rutilus septentrionalis]|uniref:pancreatic lipase-related protein 2-like n=1 Tax=Toxorhynchites rutilus septentrionalis TaxID=329112 RepID=UPI002478A1FB|nr:pancreatic lipase-related protein 2-like [Toxorhynchites rutilus septentrionalis]
MQATNTTGFMLQTMLYMVNHGWNNSLYNAIHNVSSTGNMSLSPEDTRCYGVYGCFPLTYPWVDDKRPLAYHPRSPAQINVRFPVFNKPVRERPQFIDINDPDEVKRLGINPNGKIYFVTHGYIESGDRPWIQNLVNALLDNDSQGTATVVIIDWRKGSIPPYSQCVADIRLIGAIAAHVIHLLYQELGMRNLDKVHLMGHSLGSHLCGYVGYFLQRDFGLQVGRITGMDPAEPMFADTDPLVRLDVSDAKFVDVIHTDAVPWVERWPRPGGLGMHQAVGHVDFYPNGGSNQAGCNDPMEKFIRKHENSFFWGFQEFFGCNHVRCHQLYLDAIPQRCPFVAIGCESYEKFLAGECFECDVDGHHCIDFGPNAQLSYRRLIENGNMVEPRQIRAFMITGDDSPYCRTHYKVTLVLSDSEESRIHGGEVGKLSLEFIGQQRERSERMEFSKESFTMEPGRNYSSVMAGKDVGLPKKAFITWEYQTNPLNPMTWRLLATPRIYVAYVIVQTLEHRSRQKFCPVQQEPIQVGRDNDFRAEYCFD